MTISQLLASLLNRERRRWAHCQECLRDVRLSEWFIRRDDMRTDRHWGMFCVECGAVSPWIDHAAFRDGGSK